MISDADNAPGLRRHSRVCPPGAACDPEQAVDHAVRATRRGSRPIGEEARRARREPDPHGGPGARGALLLTVSGYDVALDLRSAIEPPPATGPRTFRSTTTIRFDCAEEGAATFVDLVAPHVHSVTLNGETLRVEEVFDGARVTLSGLRAANEVTIDAQCAYSRTGEGLHHFLDPEDGQVYLYTQYEPADARRVFATFEQPDLKAPFDFTVTAPAGWTVLSNGAREGEPRPVDDGAADLWRFARTEPISTYVHHRRRRGPLPLRRRHLPAHPRGRQRAGDPAGRPVPQGAGTLLRPAGHLHRHQAGAGLLPRPLRLPVPVRQVRPGVRAGVQHRRHGEPGLRDLPRGVRLPRQGHRGLLRGPRQRHPARDGAHVVRRPGHHGVVGRPVAQGVLRGLHGRFRAGGVHPLPGRLDHLRQPPQVLGLPRRPAPPPPTRSPPTSGTWRTPSSTSTASPTPRAPPSSSSSSPTSARTPSWRAPGATSNATNGATPGWRTCCPCWRRPRAGTWPSGPGHGCRPPGSTPSRRSSPTTRPAGVTELAVLQEAASAEHPVLRPHRVAVGLYRRDPARGVLLERYARAEVDVARARAPRSMNWPVPSGRTWCW